MKENVIQIIGWITINADVHAKNIIFLKKIIFGMLLDVVAKSKHSASIMEDSMTTYSMTTCGEITEEKAEKVTTNFNEKMQSVKQKISIIYYILLIFYFLHLSLIAIALLVAVSIYCYLIKYRAKQKRLLPFYVTNNESKEIMYW